MKWCYVAFFAFILIESCYGNPDAVAGDFKCYHCLHYEGLPESGSQDQIDGLPFDATCNMNNSPHPDLLQPCKDSGRLRTHDEKACALVYFHGKQANGKEFEITLRSCVPFKEELRHVNLTTSQFKAMPSVDDKIKNLLPDGGNGQAWMCQANECNWNATTAEAKSEIEPNSIVDEEEKQSIPSSTEGPSEKDASTTASPQNQSAGSSAELPTVCKLGFVLLTTIISFLM